MRRTAVGRVEREAAHRRLEKFGQATVGDSLLHIRLRDQILVVQGLPRVENDRSNAVVHLHAENTLHVLRRVHVVTKCGIEEGSHCDVAHARRIVCHWLERVAG